MEKLNFIKLIENPLATTTLQSREIKKIIDDFPYFQSARIIYLKGLKDSGSFRYNNELKKTASYTRDRSILFDFISSENFNKSSKKESTIQEEQISGEIKNKTDRIEGNLEIGKPFNFNENESFSFDTWLDLSESKRPIIRNKKSKQDTIIDNFINNNPKIPKIDKSKPLEVKPTKEPEQQQLMTETLAKIYLQQNKYDNAIKAYEILILKYPEKSGYFADRIVQIKKIQKSK